MPASHCRSSAADLRMRTAKLCNYFQKTKCVRTHLYFFAKKEKPELLFFCSVPLAKPREPIAWARGLPANPASGKATHPGTVTDRYTRGGLTPGLATDPSASLSGEAPARSPGQKPPCRQNLPLRRNRPIGKAVPIGETAPSEKPFRSTALSAPIGRAAYADAPFAACPSLRAEATACAAPSAHCSAACRS